MSKHVYEQSFFNYLDRSSSVSAQYFLEILDIGIPVNSVLDVGCGRGAWLAEWRKRGVEDVQGVDGHYVDTATLLVPRENFHHHDLAEPLNLARKFDLAECLEVAEHLEAQKADVLLDSIVRHSDLVLFSAATPGQGGEHHVNEQPLEYWADKFAERGYRCFDCIRDKVLHHKGIEPWYRYNTLLYVRDTVVQQLPEAVVVTERVKGEKLKDVAPFGWRLRNAIIGLLPAPLIGRLAKVKHYFRARG